MSSQIGRSINGLIRDALEPSLKAAGFRRQGRDFRRSAGDAIHVIGVQGSKWNAGAEGQFTINLGVYFPAAVSLLNTPREATDTPDEADCLVRRRIGRLMPVGKDYWWEIKVRTDLEQLGHEVRDALLLYGVPWFDAVPDLSAAGRHLEAQGSYFLAAVAALATGDRALAVGRVQRALTQFPDPTLVRGWGVRHGLLDDPTTA